MNSLQAKEKTTDEKLLFYKRALEETGIGLWNWDINKDELFWDKNCFQIYGLSRDKWKPTYQDGFWKFIHDEDKTLVSQAVRRSIELNSTFSIVFRVGDRFVRSFGSCYYDPDKGGKVLSGISVGMGDREFTTLSKRFSAEDEFCHTATRLSFYNLRKMVSSPSVVSAPEKTWSDAPSPFVNCKIERINSDVSQNLICDITSKNGSIESHYLELHCHILNTGPADLELLVDGESKLVRSKCGISIPNGCVFRTVFSTPLDLTVTYFDFYLENIK
jgi:hypothetical protein